jgi:hypothetical protein
MYCVTTTEHLCVNISRGGQVSKPAPEALFQAVLDRLPNKMKEMLTVGVGREEKIQ